MISLSANAILPSLSVAALIVASAADPPTTGASGCTDLASRQGVNITYTDVVKCFDSIPFNKEAAKTTLESVTTLFDDYYISRDSAMSPFLAKPLESDPVDIVAKLKKIGRTRYTSDRKFHTDVNLAIESLHDGHSVYVPYCYMAYMYTQPLSLYAPVVDGRQVIKVYNDNKKRGYEECTVTNIDGKTAMAQVKKYASTLVTSKDPNGRLNEALTSMVYSPSAGTFVVFPGRFAIRVYLPDSPSMRFELKCANSKAPIIVNDNWVITPQLPWVFTDTASYIKNVCLAQPEPPQPSAANADSPHKRDLVSVSAERRDEINALSKRAFSDNYPAQAAVAPHGPSLADDSVPLPLSSPVYDAIKIGAGNGTVFYQLKDRPTVGIIVLFITLIDFAEIDFMYQSLETLYHKGVTDIIIDVVGGDGGYANVSPDFAQLFFPNKGPLDKILPVNFRSTPALQQLSAKVFNSTDGGLSQLGNMFSTYGGGFYDSSRFFDLANNRMYTDNSLYTDTVTQYRNGRQAVYTKLTAYKPVTHPVHSNLAKYPWTNNPDRLRIVTDGRCLSACGHVIYLLANQYGVKSYGVGGTQGEPLSKHQYVAAAATTNVIFKRIFAFANMTSPMKDLPYQGIVTAAIGEIFAPGSTVPLEFDGDKYPTDFRLDYDPVNARSREALWTQVAKAAWK
ncbi:hypothetical protein BGZ96_006904 [Linnemannia gamsii]|uniref:Tail specific protease domain-containing protein n=1 Tax=Linnemannia gamsii TaxID=64522 RepID=A0ABQ7KE00_9FUNG|nr:hypothetical protein BGZ96_006904 [Linnemannia gamsii]